MTAGPDRKKVILVVDDEAHIRHVVSLKLSNAGFEVVTAGDGEEGLELARQHELALVVTDYQMPFMSGLQMCQQLKACPATASVPAIMLTARGFRLSAEDLQQTNIVSVLGKPFSPRQILAKVQELTEAVAV